MAAVSSKVDPFDVGSGAIARESRKGTVEVQIPPEEDPRVTWQTHTQRTIVPSEAWMVSLGCEILPAKGFLGIGSRMGTWRVSWSAPFQALVAYKLPAQVAVRAYEVSLRNEIERTYKPKPG